jgi:hypothetical protein
MHKWNTTHCYVSQICVQTKEISPYESPPHPKTECSSVALSLNRCLKLCILQCSNNLPNHLQLSIEPSGKSIYIYSCHRNSLLFCGIRNHQSHSGRRIVVSAAPRRRWFRIALSGLIPALILNSRISLQNLFHSHSKQLSGT